MNNTLWIMEKGWLNWRKITITPAFGSVGGVPLAQIIDGIADRINTDCVNGYYARVTVGGISTGLYDVDKRFVINPNSSATTGVDYYIKVESHDGHETVAEQLKELLQPKPSVNADAIQYRKDVLGTMSYVGLNRAAACELDSCCKDFFALQPDDTLTFDFTEPVPGTLKVTKDTAEWTPKEQTHADKLTTIFKRFERLGVTCT